MNIKHTGIFQKAVLCFLWCAVVFFLFSCKDSTSSGSGKELTPLDLSHLDLNAETGIEIVTWNIERFPQRGDTTIQRVAEIITGVNADIYCFQEVADTDEFSKLLEKLPDYTGTISQESRFIKPAVIYRKDDYRLIQAADLLLEGYGDSTSFYFASRTPLRMDLEFRNGFVVSLINLHLKAFGDPQSRYRRWRSVEILHRYVEQQFIGTSDSNFVFLGDWNDDLVTISDSLSRHTLFPFWQDSADFRFLTYELATDADESNDSYQDYDPPSFLDHILISKALFDEAAGGEVQTLQLDQEVEGYFSYVSDHYPVVWRFVP